MRNKERIKNSVIFFEIILNKLIACFKKTATRTNNILIIKADVIGDYIVFRNYLSNFKQSPRYKDSRITLLANVILQNLAQMLDNETVDEFLWVDYKKYAQFSYKRHFFSYISKRGFDEVIVFHYSRTLFTDVVAFSANAKHKIAMSNDFTWISPRVRKFTDKFYTKLIFIPETYSHEFRKNSFFAEQITGIAPSLIDKLPTLNIATINDIDAKFNLPISYIVVSSGAGEAKRRLPYNKMLLLTEHLLLEGNILCFTGTSADSDFVAYVLKKLPSYLTKIIDLTGKTSLSQMLYIVNRAKLVICNESSLYHISIAMQKPVVCFSGGGHFKRWAIYGENENAKVVFEPMPCFNCDWNCIYKINEGDSFPCIQSISDTNVVKAVKHLHI